MDAKVYELFKQTNPRIKSYERGKGKVLIRATCSLEHKDILEELITVCKNHNDVTVEKNEETNSVIYFTVMSKEDFTDKLVKDFF